ncbi:MAG TPA: gfo/Idh/MocA family oxidoreductase [Cytophagales bacterium]|nr:gfo/Idh/MocA family oxidoreductase [Cytophagales bacterium]HAA19627.1 gfo/Idh/MocA family oxidoreductase [Cytophagales bacterium]HAP58151.1 gfo/Idh/MocA family oxidoreductase [Cytophagales bacterium]
MKKIRWGIISTGTIAHQFAQDIRLVDSAELVAVASRTQASADAFASQYGIPTAHASYEALYQDGNVDAIYIATPHNFHRLNTLDAMAQGKAVLCEKPITISTAELDELVAYATEKKVYLMEAMWTYFLPAIQQAKAWVEEGRIGRIVHLKSEFGYPVPFDPKTRNYNPDLAGGALLDMGVYNVAMAWYFLEQVPEVIAVQQHAAASGVEDDVFTTAWYANDQYAHLHTSFRTKLQNHTFIFGEQGYIQLPDFWRASEAKLYERDTCLEHFQDHRKGMGFEFQIEAVNQDILAGRLESSVVPHATSRYFQKQMDDIRAEF